DRPAALRYSVTTFEPGARLLFTHGLRVRPRSIAFFATRPAPIMTLGFDVFVQLVIAAITTAPWSSSSTPRSATATPDCATAPVADDTLLAQQLRDGEHQVGCGRALRQRTRQPHAEHLRDEHRARLAEHRGLRLDAADAPAHHAKAVDHRRVGIGAEHRIRIGHDF